MKTEEGRDEIREMRKDEKSWDETIRDENNVRRDVIRYKRKEKINEIRREKKVLQIGIYRDLYFRYIFQNI